MVPEDDIVRPDVASAGLHVSERIGQDVASTQLDLEESLEASRYASHPYSAHPKDWPALVEVSELRELPSVLVERYHSVGEVTTLCGMFPEIHRAWASVDNSMFIWRYDKWDGQCKEHNEEQAVLAVGLAKAKPGVFVEAIQYILVLATPIEVFYCSDFVQVAGACFQLVFVIIGLKFMFAQFPKKLNQFDPNLTEQTRQIFGIWFKE